MTILPDFIKSAISDGDKENPQTSVGRLIALSIVTLCVLIPACVWAWLSLWQSKLVEMPGSYIGFMTAAGTLAGAMYSITKGKE